MISWIDTRTAGGFARFCVLLVLLVLALAMVSGADLGHADVLYMAPTAAGTGDGSDFTNRANQTTILASLAYDDTIKMVGAGRGDTYSAMTIESITDVAGKYIVFEKVTTDDSGVAGYQASFADSQAVIEGGLNAFASNIPRVVLDGMYYTVWDNSTTYGILLLSNVTTRAELVCFPAYGDRFEQADSCEVRNAAMCTQGPTYDVGQRGVYSVPDTTMTLAGTKVINCYFSGGSNAIIIRSTDDAEIRGCYFAPNWSSASNHGEQIAPGININGIKICWNWFESPKIFAIGYTMNWPNNGADIYNNVFNGSQGELTALVGSAQSGNTDICKGMNFYHNTINNVDMGARGAVFVGNLTSTDDKAIVFNNFFTGCDFPDLTNGIESATYIDADYNYAYNCTGSYNIGDNAVEWPSDPTETGAENFDLTVSLPCSSAVALATTDIEGETRNASDPDAGAYEYETVSAVIDTVDTLIYLDDFGYILSTDADYATSRNKATANAAGTDRIQFGQNADYDHNRAPFSALLPSNLVTALTCSLCGYHKNDAATTDFDLAIVSGTWGTSITKEDFDEFVGHAESGPYSITNLVSWNSSSYVTSGYSKVPYNAAGLDSLEAAAGDTLRQMILSMEDVNNSVPTTNEFIGWEDNDAGKEPYLHLIYTTGEASTPEEPASPSSGDVMTRRIDQVIERTINVRMHR